MKKILSIALVAILAAGSAFATFSGNANVALGYNWETKAYGFSNGTGFDFDIDLATADAEEISEGNVYAGIKASMAFKLANLEENPDVKDAKGNVLGKKYSGANNGKGSLIWQKDGENAALGVFFAIDEAYVAGEGWKLDISGTQGAPDFAKSAIDTKKDAVKDIWGNQYDTEDVPVSYKVAAKDAAGVTLTVADWKASVGFEGSNNETYKNEGTYWEEKEKDGIKYYDEPTKGKFEGKYFNYNAFLQTPEFDFDVVSFQAAAIASRNENAVKPADRFDTAIGASAKVGFDADIVAGSVAADYGVKLTENTADKDKLDATHGLDIAANLAISPITLDVYFMNENLTSKSEGDAKLAENLLSAQVKADLAAFEIPVAITVYGKDMLDKTEGQDFGAKAEMAFDAFSVTAKGGYKLGEDKLYIGGEVGYTHDLFAVKAGADWSILTKVDDSNVLSVKASVESSAIIPGATLSLAYGAADEDMNLLEQAGSGVAQNFGKVEAKCKIEF